MTQAKDADAAAATTQAPGLSGAQTGVSLVRDNLEAFALRALSARAARRTLDLQYYTWAEDVTGHLLIRDVLDAADRGVQVRLLLDDLYVRKSECALDTLALHPSIQIRVYNPFQIRWLGKLGDGIEFLFAGYRLEHRMHNKAWTADGEFAVCGGRNIGDEYFGAPSQFNFRDLDLAIEGRAVDQVVGIFDRFWNSAQVRPIDHLAPSEPLEGGLPTLRRRLEAVAASEQAKEYLDRLHSFETLPALLQERRVVLDTGRVHVSADPPGKGRGRRRAPVMHDAVWSELCAAETQVSLISPYFIPGRRGSLALRRLARRGVHVSVLTNSLAATDVLAVHGSYARYRRRLLRAGVKLHELKPGGQQGTSLLGSGHASLHTKAFAVDGDLAFVGSFNLDPRSAYLNTEMGTFVHSRTLAGALDGEFKRLTDPARSWTVLLQRGHLRWNDRVDGQRRAVRREPDSSLTRRVLARIMGWLPIQPQL